MWVDLVRVTAEDGVRLDGVLRPPADADARTLPVDAALLVHGTGSNFYGSTLTEALADELTRGGVAALLVNTRGHDLVSTAATKDGPIRGGAAYEIVDDCRLDLAAWCGLLAERGYQRVALIGHSSGALKSLYAAAHVELPGVCCVVAISPPRLSASRFLEGAHGEQFAADLATAQEHVRAGRASRLMDIRFPLPYAITAAGFVDKYGPAERYDLLRFLTHVRVPVQALYGSQELQTNEVFRGLDAQLESLDLPRERLCVETIAGADHFYAGARDQLWGRIERWLRRR